MVRTAPTLNPPFPVVCLDCGEVRVVRRTPTTNLDAPACPACGYVGWREARRDHVAPLGGQLVAVGRAPHHALQR